MGAREVGIRTVGLREAGLRNGKNWGPAIIIGQTRQQGRSSHLCSGGSDGAEEVVRMLPLHLADTDDTATSVVVTRLCCARSA